METRDVPAPTEERPALRQSAPRRPWARIPRAAWACFTVALLNGIAWGLIIPLFQTPDEPAHAAYVQYVAETGRPPGGDNDVQHFSAEEAKLLAALRYKEVQRREHNRLSGTATFQKRLERVAEANLERTSGGGYTTATNNPPLYYYGAAAAYRLSPSSALHDRMHVLRGLSALLAAVTVLLIFLFLRELLPGTPWAWTVGALVVAFQPMFGFTSSGVSSDALLYPASAGIFYLFALAFRRGLTARLGIAIGALAAVGLLSKTTMLGLAPGIAFGLVALVLVAKPDRRSEAVRGALAALAVGGVPVLLYVGLNSTVWDRGVWFGNAGIPKVNDIKVPGPGGAIQTESASVFEAASYMWQFYLPRLPFMEPHFDTFQLRHVWFDGFIGSFGWLDYRLTGWVYDASLAVAFALVALAARELVSLREVVKRRLWELATYIVLAIGLLTLVGGTGYLAREDGATGYEQPRYLFPLLALYGALVAIAARGAGRRYGPAVGVLLICLAVAHTAVAMLLTMTRYYG